VLNFGIIHASSLPGELKQLLLTRQDQRINNEGVIIIKVQQCRSQEQNRVDALTRLQELIQAAISIPKKRTCAKQYLTLITIYRVMRLFSLNTKLPLFTE